MVHNKFLRVNSSQQLINHKTFFFKKVSFRLFLKKVLEFEFIYK